MLPPSLANARILIVDDQDSNVHYLERILRHAGYQQLWSTVHAREVVGLCATVDPDLVLLDLHMPELDGFAVMQLLAAQLPAATYLPILVLTADGAPVVKERALSHGAKDFLTKPLDRTETLLRIRNLLETRMLHREVLTQNLALEARVRERTHALEHAELEVLRRLAQAAEYRDDDTGQHTQRVGQGAALLAAALGLSPDEVEIIRLAAPLHDVGKIGIPDAILLKPSKLTPLEFEVIRSHTTIGAQMLTGSLFPTLQVAEQIALTHHERWDGLGYPHGLAGAEIPLVGRIVSVVDVFDALTHARRYKHAWTAAEALSELVRQKARQFDPDIVDAFVALGAGAELSANGACVRALEQPEHPAPAGTLFAPLRGTAVRPNPFDIRERFGL